MRFLSGVLVAAILGASAAGASAAITPADEKLDILFLGGTGFLGPHQVNYALDRGHNVTVFERDDQLGGLLRYGIPDFKMEKKIIDRRSW